MKKVKISVLVLLFVFLASIAFAAQLNSTTYVQRVVVSSGGENVSSESYKMNIATGIINMIINSSSYINKLGFFHFLLLADNQPCTSADQCEGGFCCSSLCKSSACPTEGAAPSGGGGAAAAAGGGGGGAIEAEVKDFSLSTNSIKEQLALGDTKVTVFTITNTGNTELRFELNVAVIDSFVSLPEASFSLGPGEEKTVEISIVGRRLGSYPGTIDVTADGVTKSIDVIVEVESVQVLFDAKIDIPSAYKEVEPGSELKAQITLLNIGPPRKVDVIATYLIKDKQGNVVYESSETFAVETQKSFVKSFSIPKDLPPGDYLAIIEVRYENSFAVSSELFRVLPKGTSVERAAKSNAFLITVAIVFAGLALLSLYFLMPRIRFFAGEDIDRFYDVIYEAQKAFARGDILKAEQLYAKARKIYASLNENDKKEVYKKLADLYKRLKG